MSAVSNSFLKIIDFFLSPENRVSAQARMRARIVVSIFLLWAFLDVVGFFANLFTGQSDLWAPGTAIFINLFFAALIKMSFSPLLVKIKAPRLNL